MIEEKGQEKRKQKKFEIIRGNSKDLNISNVKDSLIIEKPEENKKDNIVIPETVNSSDEQ